MVTVNRNPAMDAYTFNTLNLDAIFGRLLLAIGVLLSVVLNYFPINESNYRISTS
jgi:hypothetical protein